MIEEPDSLSPIVCQVPKYISQAKVSIAQCWCESVREQIEDEFWGWYPFCLYVSLVFGRDSKRYFGKISSH